MLSRDFLQWNRYISFNYVFTECFPLTYSSAGGTAHMPSAQHNSIGRVVGEIGGETEEAETTRTRKSGLEINKENQQEELRLLLSDEGLQEKGEWDMFDKKTGNSVQESRKGERKIWCQAEM